jgi:hypothetical protein
VQEINAVAAEAASGVDKLSNSLKLGTQTIDSYINNFVASESSVEDLLRFKTRLQGMRNAILNNAMDPVINHLEYVLNHPENQIFQNDPNFQVKTDFLNDMRAKLAQARQVKGPGVAILNEQIRKVKNIIQSNQAILKHPALNAMHKLSNVLNVIGGVATGVQSAYNSPASNTALKVIGGFVSGGLDIGLMAVGGLPAAADKFLGNNLGGSLNNTVDTVTALTEFLLGGDIRATESLVEKMKAGGNGTLVQALTTLPANIEALGDPAQLERVVRENSNSSNPIVSVISRGGEGAGSATFAIKGYFDQLFSRS